MLCISYNIKLIFKFVYNTRVRKPVNPTPAYPYARPPYVMNYFHVKLYDCRRKINVKNVKTDIFYLVINS